jgi:hypothetical protein
MRIRIDSIEYRCWHEVGHASICLSLGGGVDFIELLEDDVRGPARARCVVTPEIKTFVACGGFAAEFYLLKHSHAVQDRDDERDINRVLFHNATSDHEDFRGRKLSTHKATTEVEDREFMNHAIGSHGLGGVIPIFNRHFSGMQELVRELCETRRVDRKRVKGLLRLGNSRGNYG